MDSKGLGQRLVRRVAHRGDRGDGRARRGADPPRPHACAGSSDDDARAARRLALEAEYETRFSNPYVAAERGYVDEVIAAEDTRRILADTLVRFATKREVRPAPQARQLATVQPSPARPLLGSAAPKEAPCCSKASASSSPACSTTDVDRVLDRPLRAGAGRRGGALVVRTDHEPHPALGPSPAHRAPGGRARRHQHRRPRRARRARRREARRRGARHRLRARVVPRRRLPRRSVGGRRGGPPGVGLLAQVAGGGRAAADGPGRLDRGPRLRQHQGVAGLRLDGRGQVGVRVHRPLPRSRPRAEGHPGQPGRRGPACARSRRRASPASSCSRSPGRPGPPSAGT